MAHRTTAAVAAVGMLYAARRYFLNWGTTKAECEMWLPGDDLVGQPAVQTTEGVSIGAPVWAVWPWLLQIGQDRGGLYGYQKVEDFLGLHYCNADRIHPEWQQLAPDDTVRLAPKGWMGLRDGLALRVVDIVEQSSIVLRATTPAFHSDAVWSFNLIPYGDDRSRLLVRSRTALRHPGQVLAVEFSSPTRAFITRGMLIGIRRRAESQGQAEACAKRASDDHHRLARPNG